ncbi:MAG: flagellar hook-basal body complex protein FliE [Pirellulaceae bacterium]
MSIPPVGPVGGGVTPSAATSASSAAGGNSPGNVFAEMVNNANQQQLAADTAIEELAAGNTDSLHQVVLTAAKADLSFRMVLEMRNKLVESYQEIMRMQV